MQVYGPFFIIEKKEVYGRRNEIMSRELTLIEKMGVEFEERDGLFYPLMDGNASGEGVKMKAPTWTAFPEPVMLSSSGCML